MTTIRGRRIIQCLDLFCYIGLISFSLVLLYTIIHSFVVGSPFVFKVYMNNYGEGWPELIMLAFAVAWSPYIVYRKASEKIT